MATVINQLGMALDYNKCIKYVMLFRLFGWIEIVSDDGQFVAITEKGRESLKPWSLLNDI